MKHRIDTLKQTFRKPFNQEVSTLPVVSTGWVIIQTVCMLLIQLMRASWLSLLGALVVWINFRVVESVDALKRTHLGNFNYSYFTGNLFTTASGICFDDPDYQTLGFIDKFTDAAEVSVPRPLGVLSYFTSRVVLNQSIILFDLGYKNVSQSIMVGTNSLVTITVGEEDDQSHIIDVDFPEATCERQKVLANTNDNSSVSDNVTCATTYGNNRTE